MRPSRLALAAAFAAIYLLWGGTFLAIRYAVAEVPPLLTIAIRCLGGAGLLFAWLGVQGHRARGTGPEWLTALVAGGFLFLGCHAVLAWVEQRVTSGEAALLMTAIPLWLVLLSAARERRLPPLRVLAGLGLGVAGVGLLAGAGGAGAGSSADRLWLVASALFWAIGSLIARYGPRAASAVQSTAMQLAAGGGVVLLASALGGEVGSWQAAETSSRAVLALGFLVVGGTALGFGAYTWLLRVTSPAAVGTYAFVNPVVALALAWGAGDGELTGRVAAAAGIVVVAVALTWAPGAAAASPASATRHRPFASLRVTGGAGRVAPAGQRPDPSREAPPAAGGGAGLHPLKTRVPAAAPAAGA